MKRLLEKLHKNKMSLIVSLPVNSYEFAKVAWESGADAIKVHINVFHRASQNNFGSLDEMKEVFTKILKDSPIPVGIVAGEDVSVVEESMDEIVKMGFDFISLYGHHTPPALTMRDDITNFFAVNNTYSLEDIRYISSSFVTDILELSIMAPENYGKRLSASDLAKYEYIASFSKAPTVVPTQKLVYPSDIPALYKTKVNAIMIGAISTSKELNTFENKVKAFRREIDKL